MVKIEAVSCVHLLQVAILQMNALDRIPDKFEIPQYEFLGRKVAAEKFLPKGWGNLVDAKPLRTHVCVVDRQVRFVHRSIRISVLVGDLKRISAGCNTLWC